MKQYRGVRKHSIASPARDRSWGDAVPPAMKRRDARIWRMAYAAAAGVVAGNGACQPRSVIVGTALGALEETRQFLDGVFTDGLGSPRNFIASVHNSIAGKLALEFKIGGPNLTVCDSHNSFASALVSADLLADSDFPVLLCIVDERLPLLDDLHPHFTRRCRSFCIDQWEEAAVAFLLTDAPAAGDAAVRAFGPVPAERRDPESVCRGLMEANVPGFTGAFHFDGCSTSFVQPAIIAADLLRGGDTPAVVGSFSPTSGAAAIVELAPTT